MVFSESDARRQQIVDHVHHAILRRSLTNRPRSKVGLAALLGDSEADVVALAIDEYVARHANKLEAGLSRARQALHQGPVSEIAYLLDTDPEDVARVSGATKAIHKG